jgi:hypothetical protein
MHASIISLGKNLLLIDIFYNKHPAMHTSIISLDKNLLLIDIFNNTPCNAHKHNFFR